MKILWTTNIPAPYRVNFFSALGEAVDLTVLFERLSSSERDESWSNFQFENFSGVILPSIKLGSDKAFSIRFIKYFKKHNWNHIVISNPLTPTGIMMIFYLKLKRKKYCIETDGGFAKNGKGFKEKFKRFVLKNANAYFSTAVVHDQYYLNYGAKKANIYRYPFTSLIESDLLKGSLSANEKMQLRKKLKIRENKVVLSVGRNVYLKGYDVLLKAAHALSREIGIYIVGGTPTEELIEQKNELILDNVHFIDFQEKDALKEYYQAADVFVFPTRNDIWGLVINEAMANALPIISTNKSIAGLELVKDGSNGYLIESNDSKALSEKINAIIFNETILNKMSKSSLKIIQEHTIENMVRRHLGLFEKI